MKTITREYGQSTYVANKPDQIDLPRDYAQNDIDFELYAKITIVAAQGGDDAGILADYAPAGLVSQISIRANGSDIIKSMTFQDMVIQTALRYGVLPNNTVLAAGTAQVGTECYIYGRLDFSMFRTIKPYDTLFNSRRLISLQCLIQWGNDQTIYADDKGTNTTTIVSASLTLSGKEAVGLDANTVLPVFKESTISADISAAQSEFKIPLNYAQDLYYRQLVILTKSEGVLVNTILNNIILRSGGVNFVNINARRLRNRNKIVLGMSTLITGCYVLDFSEDGRLNDSIETAGLSSLDLILDVNHPGTKDTIRVITNESIKPTVAAK
jgi:hypothetical protein